MALFIGITKIQEDDGHAEYLFGRTEMPEAQGRLKITKATGEVNLVDEMPGDVDRRAFLRAARKIRLAWREGTYPDKTCWAS